MEVQTFTDPDRPVPEALSRPLPDNRFSLTGRILLWTSLSALFTLVILQFSLTYGKLVVHPFYDDISYFNDALERLQKLYSGGLLALASNYVRVPPHSTFSTGLAMASYLVFGARDWAPYAANGIIILALAGFVELFTRGLPLWQKVALFLFALTVPICGNAVYEFRPDIASALCAAAGVTALLSRPLNTSEWRHRAGAGALFGLALVIKTPTFPLTMILLASSLGMASVADILLNARRPSPRELTVSWAQCIGAAFLVALPVYLPQLRQIFAYMYAPVFGDIKEIWRTPGSPMFQARFYLDGPGGDNMLGRHVYLLPAIIVIGFVAAATIRRRDLAVRIGCFVAVAVVAYAVPTLMSVKSAFFGTSFDWILLFGAIYVLVLACRRAGLLRAAAILGTTLLAGMALARFVPVLYLPGAENAIDRRRIVEQLYGALKSENVGPGVRVYMTTTGFVNTDVLKYLDLKRGLPGPRYIQHAYVKDLAVHLREIDLADYVIASEQGNTEAYGGFVPTGNFQDQTLAMVRDSGMFKEVAEFPTGNPKRYFLFRRIGHFGGWEDATGLSPEDGSYQPWGLYRVRWGLGPRTILRLRAQPGGDYRLIVEGRAANSGLEMTIEVNGVPAGKHRFPKRTDFEAIDLPLHLTPGPHQVELRYSDWDRQDSRLRAVLFKTLEIAPLSAAKEAGKVPGGL